MKSKAHSDVNPVPSSNSTADAEPQCPRDGQPGVDSPPRPTGGPPATPSLAALLQLIDPANSLDPKLNTELSPLTRQLLTQIDPADPCEWMLAAQILATFTRSMFLARHANRQKHPAWFSLYSKECDRAMTQYRQQMQLLDEHRRPASSRRTSFTAIRNANIAGQQVITINDPTVPPPAEPPMPNPFKKPKRPYRLSATGAAALRKSALKTRPWLLSPGPSSPQGKLAIRNNNLQHGYYAQVPMPGAAAYKAYRKSLTRAGLHRSDPGPPVIDQ